MPALPDPSWWNERLHLLDHPHFTPRQRVVIRSRYGNYPSVKSCADTGFLLGLHKNSVYDHCQRAEHKLRNLEGFSFGRVTTNSHLAAVVNDVQTFRILIWRGIKTVGQLLAKDRAFIGVIIGPRRIVKLDEDLAEHGFKLRSSSS